MSYRDKNTDREMPQWGQNGAAYTMLVNKQGEPQDPPGTPNVTVNTPAATPASLVSRTGTSVAGTNAKLIKAGATTVLAIDGMCTAMTAKYLRLYDKGSLPTVGTDTAKLMFALAPGQRFHIEIPPAGFQFTAGLGMAITTMPADNDNTAVAAGDVVGLNIIYA